MLGAQRVHGGRELDERLVHVVPVDPGQLGVLAVGVVVALLGAAQLVAVQDHRHALGEQQGGDEVALLPGAQREDLGIVGGPSAPQFQDRLCDSPSLLPSPLASLCFSL